MTRQRRARFRFVGRAAVLADGAACHGGGSCAERIMLALPGAFGGGVPPMVPGPVCANAAGDSATSAVTNKMARIVVSSAGGLVAQG